MAIRQKHNGAKRFRPERVLGALALLLAASGCAGPYATIDRQSVVIDSLRAVDAARVDEMTVLTDSLAFLRSVESGAYWREMNTLGRQVNRLEFELATCRDGERVAVLAVDELFEPASATLTAPGRARLDALADTLGAYPDADVRVEAHSDSVPLGPTLASRYGDNWGLSAARAAAVASALAERDLPARRLAAAGLGASEPVAPNTTAAGRAANRRVEIVVLPAVE